MKTLRAGLLMALCAYCGFLFPDAAQADNYPIRPIRLLVGYAPGGAVDIVSRIIADQLQQRLGWRVVINKSVMQLCQ